MSEDKWLEDILSWDKLLEDKLLEDQLSGDELLEDKLFRYRKDFLKLYSKENECILFCSDCF